MKIYKVKEIKWKLWNMMVKGFKMYRLMGKLKRVKIIIKEWNWKENNFDYKKFEEN